MTTSTSVSTRRIHVMQVTFGMVIGGLERVVMELCRRIDPARFRLSICCLGTRGPLSDVMEREGVEVIVCPRQDRISRYLRGFELRRILRNHRVDLVHAHHTPAMVDASVATALSRIPLVATDHGKLYPTSQRWRILERAASLRADAVVAVSQHSKQELIRYQGLNPGKLRVIYNGLELRTEVDVGIPDRVRRELGIAAGDFIVGTAARLEAQKGLQLLLEAATAVIAQAPRTRFVIVGGGNEEAALRQRIAELGLQEHVIITGFRIDAVDLVSAFDCFLQTSHWEAMPMALLEAMALEKPVVATAVGGVPEVVIDGHTGILVQTRDASRVASALLSLVTRPDLARQFGRAGRARYLDAFTSKGMIAEYERLYTEVIRRRSEQGDPGQPVVHTDAVQRQSA